MRLETKSRFIFTPTTSKRLSGAGDRVLEAGAGAGRFTIELAKLGVEITVGDVSKVQLDLNERYVSEAELEAQVVSRVLLDVSDLSGFKEPFDAVVCYGGPLSYVLDKAEQTFGELLRLTKPGGYALLSVMSLLGTTRSAFEKITTLDTYPEVVNRVNSDGVLMPNLSHFPHKMYRFSELKALVQKYPCHLVAASAANYLSPGRDEFLATHLQSPERKEQFLAWELDYCAEEGAIDGGHTHYRRRTEGRSMKKILVIDNYDSFTYNLVQYLGELGVETVVWRNNQFDLEAIRDLNPDGIVISPGPCTPNEAGHSVEVIKQYDQAYPILGVCLGHQSIGAAYGANVVRANKIMHGKTSQVRHDGTATFKNLPEEVTATRYHSLIVRDLPTELVPNAWVNDDGEEVVMGLRHAEYPVWGVQFHPESILTDTGHKMLQNFLDIC